MKALPLFSFLNHNPMMYFVLLHMFVSEGNGYSYRENKGEKYIQFTYCQRKLVSSLPWGIPTVVVYR